MQDPVTLSEQFYRVMSTRRTVRHFSSKILPDGIIENAILTAGTAPSGANTQPWFFAVIKSQELKDQLREATEAVEQEFYQKSATQEWLKDLAPLGTDAQKPYLSTAPVIIAVFTRHRPHDADPQKMKRSYYPVESTGIAVGMLITALHQAGLSTLTHTPRPMNFLNKLLKLDESYRPFMLVVAGYPAEGATLPVIHRKSLSEINRTY